MKSLINKIAKKLVLPIAFSSLANFYPCKLKADNQQTEASINREFSIGFSYDPNKIMMTLDFLYLPRINHKQRLMLGLKTGTSSYSYKNEKKNKSLEVDTKDILPIIGYSSRYRKITKFNPKYHMPCYFQGGGQEKRKKEYTWNYYGYFGLGRAFLNEETKDKSNSKDGFNNRIGLGTNVLAYSGKSFALGAFGETIFLSHLIKKSAADSKTLGYSYSIQAGLRLIF